MDRSGTERPEEPARASPTMREMMERMCSDGMCGPGPFSPAEMCRRMMSQEKTTTEAGAQAGPECCTPSEDGEDGVEGAGRRGCCEPPSRRAP